MTLSKQSRKLIRPCTFVWLTLMVLTLVTLSIGQMGLSGMNVVIFILVTTFIKGQMVADFFMGLKRVRWAWRIIVLLYMVFVCTMIGIAYWISL
jgi:cytochrome c oxidase subunit 4